jgi:hypothetical protein
MKTWMVALAVWAGTTSQAQASQPPAPGLFRQHLADYDAELRRLDGRVDIDAMVARLQELGVTTYYWLIWHAPTDGDDLNLFLPKAAEAGIDVWVYLVPPSESPPKYGNRYSEPFRLDYVRWAEEIARLSLEHTNLTAWVVDDFYANRASFTPAYLREMQAKAKRINPRLAFLPLMYFREITAKFAEDCRQVIDGVVTYCLDKRPQSPTFPLAQKLFREFRSTALKTDAGQPFGVSDRAGQSVFRQSIRSADMS